MIALILRALWLLNTGHTSMMDAINSVHWIGVAGGRAEEGSSSSGSSDASTRILSTLLTEMDGLESSTGAGSLSLVFSAHVVPIQQY